MTGILLAFRCGGNMLQEKIDRVLCGDNFKKPIIRKTKYESSN